MASESVTLLLRKRDGLTFDLGTQGLTISTIVESRPLQIHPQGRECYIDGARVEITELDSLDMAYVKIGVADRLDDAVLWLTNDANGTDKFYLSGANNVFDFRGEGRFIYFYVEDEQVKAQWKLSAIEVYGRLMRGRRN